MWACSSEQETHISYNIHSHNSSSQQETAQYFIKHTLATHYDPLHTYNVVLRLNPHLDPLEETDISSHPEIMLLMFQKSDVNRQLTLEQTHDFRH